MTYDLLYFGLYTVACLLAGVFVGAWLTHRGDSRRSPLPTFDAGRMFKAITGKEPPPPPDPFDLDGKPKDESKRWGAVRPLEPVK